LSVIARRLASSVARGISSGASMPSCAESARNSSIHVSVYSRSGTPAPCEPAIVLSSTSVKLIASRIWWPQTYRIVRRSTSRQT
jgi:hypothetical protein